MKVDLFRVDAVDPPLGLGQQPEHPQSQRRGIRMQPGLVNQGPDLGPRPVRRVVHQHLDLDLGGPLPLPYGLPLAQPDRTRNHLVNHGLNLRQRRPGIDQRTQQHVASHPGRGIQPADHDASAGTRAGPAIWAAR